MIDAQVWAGVWKRLCKRFNRPVDPDDMADYATYLDGAGFDTERAVRAAEVCWATREFFPRPSDFLAIDAALGWRAILAWEKASKPFGDGDTIRATRAAVPDRAMRALEAIGGLDALRGKMAVATVREHYLNAFEHVVIEDAQAAIGAPELPALPPGDPAIEGGTVRRSLPEGATAFTIGGAGKRTGRPERVQVSVGRPADADETSDRE